MGAAPSAAWPEAATRTRIVALRRKQRPPFPIADLLALVDPPSQPPLDQRYQTRTACCERRRRHRPWRKQLGEVGQSIEVR